MSEPHSKAVLILQVEDLRIRFHSRHGVEPAVAGLSFALHAGETLAIVGESGSGKSVTALALTRLLPPPPLCRIDGSILYRGRDTLTSSASELRALRGRQAERVAVMLLATVPGL